MVCQTKVPGNSLHNPAAGVTVAVGIHGLCHLCIRCFGVEKFSGQTDNFRLFHTHQFGGTGGNGFRSLRFPPHHQDRLTQGRRFLLQSAGIGHYHIAPGHQIVHFFHIDRVNEMDPIHIAQDTKHTFPHRRAQVDRIDHLHIGMAFHQLRDGVHDIDHGLAVIFSAVAGDDNHPSGLEIQFIEALSGEHKIVPDRGFHGVNGRVAGDEDFPFDSLPAEIFRVGLGRRKMQVRHIAHQHPIHLLRIRGILIAGTQARLYMADGYLMVEGRQGSGKGGGGIAVDQNQVRLGLLDDTVHAQDGLGGNLGQCLLLFHDIQIIVAFQLENLHDGVQHLPVLAGQAAQTLHLRMGRQLLDQGGHFDGLGPRAEHGHYSNLFHLQLPFVLHAGGHGHCGRGG